MAPSISPPLVSSCWKSSTSDRLLLLHQYLDCQESGNIPNGDTSWHHTRSLARRRRLAGFLASAVFPGLRSVPSRRRSGTAGHDAGWVLGSCSSIFPFRVGVGWSGCRDSATTSGMGRGTGFGPWTRVSILAPTFLNCVACNCGIRRRKSRDDCYFVVRSTGRSCFVRIPLSYGRQWAVLVS